MAGSPAFARKSASCCTCLAMSAGSETSHSIDVRRWSDASNGWRWSVVPNWWSGSEQSEEESDEMGFGINPRAPDQSLPSPTSTIRGVHGLRFANGLGRGR